MIDAFDLASEVLIVRVLDDVDLHLFCHQLNGLLGRHNFVWKFEAMKDHKVLRFFGKDL